MWACIVCCVLEEALLMFQSIKSRFTWYQRPSFPIRKKREKCVVLYSQSKLFHFVYLVGVTRILLVGWEWIHSKYKVIKICWRMLRGKQYVYAYVWAIEWIFMCYSVGEISNCAGCASFESFFYYTFLSFTHGKLRTLSFHFFCISFPLRIFHP